MTAIVLPESTQEKIAFSKEMCIRDRITSVAVLGAGAVGSYVIWGLADREDIKLGVIAEGERKERLSRQGCAINGKVYHCLLYTSRCV